MKLTDVLPREDWKILENEISDRFGLNASVFDESGLRITNGMKWANSLCPVVKGNKRGKSYICAAAHENIAGQAKKTKKSVIGECDAGLVKIAVPIFVDDQFLGVAGGCGKIVEGGKAESYLIHKMTGISETEIEKLTKDIKGLVPGGPREIVEYIERRVVQIVGDYQRRRPKKCFRGQTQKDDAVTTTV